MKISKNRAKKFGVHRIEELWKKTDGRCAYCGVKLIQPDGDPNTPRAKVDLFFSVDHIIPLSRGGTKDITNIFPACRKCNNLKEDGTIDYLRFRMMVRKNRWPHFNLAQYEFLFNRGIDLGKIEPYKFYFEIKGLK